MQQYLIILLAITFVLSLVLLLIRTVVLVRRNIRNNKDSIMSGWSVTDLNNYQLAQSFQQNHPPNSNDSDITDEQFSMIIEKGVYAWKLLDNEHLNAIIIDQFDLQFNGGENTVITNLPIPKINPIYYFEVKIYEKPLETNIGVGVVTKPYPYWRMPGVNKYSIGYHSNDGKRYFNDPFDGYKYGNIFYEGDVIGCGYRPRTGTIFFTRNGVKFNEVSCGFKNFNIFPSIGADGPCKVQLNCGQLGFVYIEANVGKWGFAPAEGEIVAPPAYGNTRDTVLLASSKIETSSLIDFEPCGNCSNNENRVVVLPAYDTISNPRSENI